MRSSLNKKHKAHEQHIKSTSLQEDSGSESSDIETEMSASQRKHSSVSFINICLMLIFQSYIFSIMYFKNILFKTNNWFLYPEIFQKKAKKSRHSHKETEDDQINVDLSPNTETDDENQDTYVSKN